MSSTHFAAQLHGHKGAADHVGRAGAGDGRGHAAGQRVVKGLVHRVDAVDAAHLGGHGVGGLVVVRALPADGLFVQADVGMRIHKAGRDQAALRMINFGSLRHFQVCADGDDLSIVNQNLSVGQIRTGDGLDCTALNQQHMHDLPCVFSEYHEHTCSGQEKQESGSVSPPDAVFIRSLFGADR